MNVELAFKHAVVSGRLIERGSTVVAGVSGGPDSMAMLYLLARGRKEHGFSLVAAHFDHKLRRASGDDAALVRSACARLQVPFEMGSAKVSLRALGDSLEQAARNARQEFFSIVAKKYRAQTIALAHTLDDQAETVLMRVVRGSGMYGLAAIVPRRMIGRLLYIRPLLGVRKIELGRLLKKQKIASAIDDTNAQDIFLRNKVRRRLLPLLEKEYNPNIREVLCSLAESAAYDHEYLASIAQKKLPRNSHSIELKGFVLLHPAIRRMMVRLAIARVQGTLRRISFQHVREIEDLAFFRPQRSIVHLPQGVFVVKKERSLVFCK